jgi:hypothetical protein
LFDDHAGMLAGELRVFGIGLAGAIGFVVP